MNDRQTPYGFGNAGTENAGDHQIWRRPPGAWASRHLNSVTIIQLQSILDPDGLGNSASIEIRDAARVILGIPPGERAEGHVLFFPE